jgi:hypothetical protein
MLVKLIEVFKPEGTRVHLDEVFVNPDAVMTIRKEPATPMINEAVDLGLSPSAEFSRISIMEGSMSRSIVVVGSPNELRLKLNKRQVLKG